MRPVRRRAACAVILLVSLAAIVYACGPDITFRAYLNKVLWRPTLRSIAAMGGSLPTEKANYAPYAGMSSDVGSAALQSLRNAYRNLFRDGDPQQTLDWPPEAIAKVSDLLRPIQPVNAAERDEIDLLRCKIQLRAAKAGDDPALAAVQTCFESYMKSSHPPALASEARGWLARTYFLRKKRAAAAKIYLDELPLTSSNIRRQRLLTSLEMLYPDTDDNRLDELKTDLDQYFDTPTHALFIADRITNSGFAAPGHNNGVEVYLELMKHLQQHKDLFQQGAQSDALALELMRATTRAGAPTMTLQYGGMISEGSDARRNPEFDWLSGAANFELGNYLPAEASLNRVLDSKAADIRQKTFAANGLIGVYARTHRPVEELHSAFLAGSLVSDDAQAYFDDDLNGSALNGWDFDMAYLLDVQLTDAELEDYLKQYPDPHFGAFQTQGPRKRSAVELVRYEQAVRHARREEFIEAARLYKELSASRREKRMEEAASLLAAVQNVSASAGQRLQPSYDYADFLSKNEDGIFFNDSLWHRMQTWAFLPGNSGFGFFGEFNYRAIPADEASKYREMERTLRDNQEEYWRAFQILDRIVEQAGHTGLGREAATKALRCLRRMSPERFGRQQEIRSADSRLSNWLLQQ